MTERENVDESNRQKNIIKGGDGTISIRQPLDEHRIAEDVYAKGTSDLAWAISPRLVIKLELIRAKSDVVDPETIAAILTKIGENLWVIYRPAPLQSELTPNGIERFGNIKGEGLDYVTS